MTNHFCLNCPLAGGDYGPIDDNDPLFGNCYQVHKNCSGWGTAPPETKESTIIEKYKDESVSNGSVEGSIDLSIERAAQQARKIKLNETKRTKTVWQCTFDDAVFNSEEEANQSQCRQNQHEIMMFFVEAENRPIKSDEEIKLEEEERKASQVKKGSDTIDQAVKIIRSKYDFKTVNESYKTFLFDGKIYSESLAESLIKAESEKIIEACTTHERNEVINKIKAQTGVNLVEFDKDPNTVTLENGILNLETLELLPHHAGNLSCVLLPVEFSKPPHDIHDDTIFEDIEENLKDTLFWKFLKNSFTVNGEFRKEDFETILEVVASPIIKRHIDEKAFMFLGQGENGKSVCLDYIKSLIGKDNISRIPLQDLADDKFMRANLAGKCANIYTDLEAGEMKHTGKIKAITSNEGIEAQEKYHRPFTLYPFAKLMFSCNRFPKIYDQTQGFFRRWIIIKWERNFENDPDRIEYLKEKLEADNEEKRLVFSCLVYLARKLNRVGKFTHSQNWKATQKAWNENADPLDYYITNWVLDSENNVSKRETYHHYKQVMIARGEIPLGIGQFGKVFAEYYEDTESIRDPITGKTTRFWQNIKLKDLTLDFEEYQR